MDGYALLSLRGQRVLCLFVGERAEHVPWCDGAEALPSRGGVFLRLKSKGETFLGDCEAINVEATTIVCLRATLEAGAVVVRFGPLLRSKVESMLRLFYCAVLAAKVLEPVLIIGESGTGKELLAKAIHAASGPGKNGKPFLAMNMAAIPEDLAEAQLFGWVKGAFTGAVDSKPGAFEAAQDGTLFLDEVGDATPAIQTKILRVLETRELSRIGSLNPVPVKARFMAATNKDLLEDVACGLFRLDLYERMACLVLKVPPLRERTEDIPILAHDLLDGSDVAKELDPRVLELLQSYTWPGNIRSLRNVLRRAAVFSPGFRLTYTAVKEAIAFSAPVPGLREPRPTRSVQIALSGLPRSTFYYRLKRGRLPAAT